MSASTTSKYRAAKTSRRLHWFARLWAVATLVYFASNADARPVSVLVVLSALPVLFRPGYLPFLAGLVGVQLLGLAAQLPYISNHWTLVSAVNAAALVSLFALAWRRRGVSGDAIPEQNRDWGAGFLATVHVLVPLVYGLAAMHKLNADFLNPQVSCAVELSARLLGDVARESWLAEATIWGTLLVEFGLATLLAIRRTRVAGVMLGLVFHAILGLMPGLGVYDFAAAMCALYVLILPREAWMAVVGGDSERQRRRRRWAGRAIVAAATCLAALYLAHSGLWWAMDSRVLEATLREGARWMVIALLVAGLLRVGLAAGVTAANDRQHGRLLWAHYVVVAAFVLNAASPYLGLKTTYSLTMFSNLRTEGDSPNHLLVGDALRGFDYQDELVRVAASDDPAMSELIGSERYVPIYEVAAQAGQGYYVLESPEGTRRRLIVDELRGEANVGWERTVLRFRQVGVPVNRCFQ